MFVLSSNNAISVFFLVVRERGGGRGGEGAQCNMFILLVVNEASGPPCSAAAKVAKQMYALRFNQILASLGATWFKGFFSGSVLSKTLTNHNDHTTSI